MPFERLQATIKEFEACPNIVLKFSAFLDFAFIKFIEVLTKKRQKISFIMNSSQFVHPETPFCAWVPSKYAAIHGLLELSGLEG